MPSMTDACSRNAFSISFLPAAVRPKLGPISLATACTAGTAGAVDAPDVVELPSSPTKLRPNIGFAENPGSDASHFQTPFLSDGGATGTAGLGVSSLVPFRSLLVLKTTFQFASKKSTWAWPAYSLPDSDKVKVS